MVASLIRFSRVGEPYWNEKPVAIVGGGPSLRGFQFRQLRHRFHVLAVNGSIFDLPWADAGFSLDQRAIVNWWPRLCHQVSMPLHFAIPRPWLPNINDEPLPHMHFLWRVQRVHFSRCQGEISSGGTSGFGALNLAWLKRARKVILFGFDYGGTDGVWHHNPHHYGFPNRQDARKWQMWAANFNNVAPRLKTDGVEVINASPSSAITAFPKCTIDEALA